MCMDLQRSLGEQVLSVYYPHIWSCYKTGGPRTDPAAPPPCWQKGNRVVWIIGVHYGAVEGGHIW